MVRIKKCNRYYLENMLFRTENNYIRKTRTQDLISPLFYKSC